jgi:uncharacterized membrane protein YhhN
MQNRQMIWLVAFAAAAAINLWAEATGNRTAVLFSKPLLMPFLAVWLLRETWRRSGRLRRELISGLMFATAGDVLLMFTETAEIFFLLGIAMFLFTQLFYAGGFFLVASLRSGYLRKAWWWGLPPLIFLVVFLVQLWPFISLGLRKPVALYAIAITLMLLSVINVYGKVPRPVFVTVLAGALLFVLSDSLIAVARFTPSFPGANVAIMATYIAAQFLLAWGTRNYLVGHHHAKKVEKS